MNLDDLTKDDVERSGPVQAGDAWKVAKEAFDNLPAITDPDEILGEALIYRELAKLYVHDYFANGGGRWNGKPVKVYLLPGEIKLVYSDDLGQGAGVCSICGSVYLSALGAEVRGPGHLREHAVHGDGVQSWPNPEERGNR